MSSSFDPASNYLNTLTSPDFTWSNSKISCWKPMYFAHVVLAYLCFFAGIGCFITRLWPGKCEWHLHAWFGFLYIIFILWTTGTSMLIHNTGLPPAVLISFIWVLGGLSVGWALIRIHLYKKNDSKTCCKDPTCRIHCNNCNPSCQIHNINPMHVNMEMVHHLRTPTSTTGCYPFNPALDRPTDEEPYVYRLFSFKIFHAAFMFTSWVNIAGRIFASDQTGDFTCYTVPYYKAINTPYGGSQTVIRQVPVVDSNYNKLPWAMTGLGGWSALLFVLPFFGSFLISVCVLLPCASCSLGDAEATACYTPTACMPILCVCEDETCASAKAYPCTRGGGRRGWG